MEGKKEEFMCEHSAFDILVTKTEILFVVRQRRSSLNANESLSLGRLWRTGKGKGKTEGA